MMDDFTPYVPRAIRQGRAIHPCKPIAVQLSRVQQLVEDARRNPEVLEYMIEAAAEHLSDKGMRKAAKGIYVRTNEKAKGKVCENA